MEKQI